MLSDQQQRHLATDPSGSFIVQAPAGSGKTEILTQRFLRLLGQVSEPEQIIALTFTRKAATEMRDRLIGALHHATQPISPASEHQRTTQTYARAVLARDQALGWQLLMQPNRLRIMTIDALCQMITHAIPIHALNYANIHEQPQTLYRQVARNCLHCARNTSPHQMDLKVLLRHLDNRQDKVILLFAQLLSQRDQWLTPIYLARNQSQAQFEHALAWIEAHELARFRQTIPSSLQTELISLLQTVVTHTGVSDSHWQALREWRDFESLDANLAMHLAALLLTSTRRLRKAFDHHIGIKREVCSAEIYDHLKTHSKQLLATLDALPGFGKALVHISTLPKPQYDAQQWCVLQALLNLLPLLVAHLELHFQETNTIDFTGIAHQARTALGNEQTPTDLALYLDHHIQHLLVDEFQDTSIQQFELLSQLVQGFETNDGRTLFVVGDPMQSIYRFRAAEVGLFLRAQQNGIGPINLRPIQLQANFRATPTLIDWVNQHAQTFFPSLDDMASGAIAFHPSIATRAADDASFIIANAYADPLHEAEAIAMFVQQELTRHPEQSIAILVRARHQLSELIPVLHQRQISFQGVDIDLLAHLPHLRDIWSLTQALLMPANRLAWLALLRSPWCGLDLADLLAIAQFKPSIYVALSHADTIPRLSNDGKIRAKYIYNVLHQALRKRGQYPLVDWLIQTLKLLHLNTILTPEQQEDLEQYWLLIKQYEQQGQIEDLDQFATQLQTLYSKKVTPSRLQIMTIHKSKGLEFDCVILPGLGAKSSQKDQALMRWLTLPTHQTDNVLLMSPVKAADDEACLLYDYLGRIDAEKSIYETQRLLYVAVTRAKQRLYLLDHYTPIRQGTFRQLLAQQRFTQIESLDGSNHPTLAHPLLSRLPLSCYQHPPTYPNLPNPTPNLMSPAEPRLIGIVTHELLRWICTYHPNDSTDIPWQLARTRLKAVGITELHAFERIQTQVLAFLNDPMGQWISQSHSDEHNEYELLIDEGTRTRIIDRTFIAEGIRWIIDFKTGQFDHQTHAHYQTQLQEYADLMQQNPRQIIRCGLYYLMNNQWIEWEPVLCLT